MMQPTDIAEQIYRAVREQEAMKEDLYNCKLTIAILLNRLGGDITINEEDFKLGTETMVRSTNLSKKEEEILFRIQAFHTPPEMKVN